MGLAEHVEHLVDRIEEVAAGPVLVRLRDELVEIERDPAHPARKLHQRRHRDLGILHGEDARAVGGEFALPIPLHEGYVDWDQGETGERIAKENEIADEDQQRAVEDMAREDVPDLVTEHGLDLVLR